MEASTSSTVEPENMYGYMNNLLTNPTAFIILVIVVLIYIIIFVSLGNSQGSTSTYTNNYGQEYGSTGTNNTSTIVIIIIAVIFIILVIFNALQYFFSIDIVASVQKLFSPTNPQLDITVNQTTNDMNPPEPIPEITNKEQVFNIPGNYYGYEDAKTLCQAYGSRLATYDEIENAYNKGGEWCNYGWSDGQMALFPTQKSTFDTLQTIPGHEHDCGRPGVNGGYMANPHIKYGVNCFGYKPKITSEEQEMMQNTTPYPQTEKDILFEKRVDYWKTKLDDILVSPFNYTTWSR